MINCNLQFQKNSLDTTDYEEKFVTKAPIDTAKPSPIAVVPSVATIAPVDIVTRDQI